MTRKIVSEMTYNVSMGTLNPTIPYQEDGTGMNREGNSKWHLANPGSPGKCVNVCVCVCACLCV